MPAKCCALNCSMGYRGVPKPAGLTFHRFPFANPRILEKWEKKLSRKDFAPTKWSRVCSLHFEAADFEENRTDKHKWRRKKLSDAAGSSKICRRRLKPDAVPRKFDGLPSYKTKRTPEKRKSAPRASSSARRQLDLSRHDETVQEFLETDRINSLNDLKEGLEKETVPDGFSVVVQDDALVLCLIRIEETDGFKIPEVLGSIVIRQSLDFSVTKRGKPVRSRMFQHICPSGKIELFSQLSNLMADLKSRDLDSSDQFSWLETALDCLDNFLQRPNKSEENLDPRTVSFCREQLRLFKKDPKARRYSSETLIFAYLTHACSPQVIFGTGGGGGEF